MSDLVFRVVLPAYLAIGLAALALMRRAVSRRTEREPVRVRLFGGGETTAGFAESVLVLSVLTMGLDVLGRAVWPRASEELLTVPLLREATSVRWSGLAVMSLGLALYFMGLVRLGLSWRIGIDRERPGALVTSGLFARIRHPLYGGILLATLGMALVTPDVVSFAAMAAAWTAVPIQARLEEEFLASLYPEYAQYRARTGRFVPRWSGPASAADER
jgi:protein-S-isoprenylcysteine O-methyltransferase Ste14